ncbi:hypothetical protein TWF694_006199 [Orbilia ellipsospora]|uniref:Uncharacterized protein n=1 Tax=Orbilia ellipsospora TaxID=2528407 RepID=A0AAV9XJV2_9PEZI
MVQPLKEYDMSVLVFQGSDLAAVGFNGGALRLTLRDYKANDEARICDRLDQVCTSHQDRMSFTPYCRFQW